MLDSSEMEEIGKEFKWNYERVDEDAQRLIEIWFIDLFP
jgi:hypothetical protein